MTTLVALCISLLAAVVPTLIFALAFYWADRYEREPLWMISVAFLWGAVPAIVVSLIGEIVIGTPMVDSPGSITEAVVASALVAPVVEELAKGVALWFIYKAFRQEFDGIVDGLTYGALIGFGFAMTENFLYFVGAFGVGGFADLSLVIFLRSVLFGLNHAFYTGLFGIGLGLARRSSSQSGRRLWALAGLAAAIAAHGLHNLGASLGSVTALGLLLSLGIAALGFGMIGLASLLAGQQERRWLEEELAEEIGVTLSQGEYQALIRGWRRPGLLDNSADRQQARRLRLNVELAFRKHRAGHLGVEREPELVHEIERIRAQIVGLTDGPALSPQQKS